LLVAAVVEMKRRNPRFGCLKIAQQIAYAFGVEVNKHVVRRILQQHYAGLPHGDGPSWLTALAHAKDSCGVSTSSAVNQSCCETAGS